MRAHKAPNAPQIRPRSRISAEAYTRVFGDRKRAARGVYVMHEGKLTPIDQVPAETPKGNAPAIHRDFATAYDPGLGYGYESKAQKRAILAGVNRRRQMAGETPLRERGF